MRLSTSDTFVKIETYNVLFGVDRVDKASTTCNHCRKLSTFYGMLYVRAVGPDLYQRGYWFCNAKCLQQYLNEEK